ncbi:MAG TPA: serine--tRNA ligase [Armatimonadaceae bacterium]|nr:serine--tRNA ligase [Armatimonadaceae bacterium]
MLDIRRIRTEPDAVKAALAKRGEIAGTIDDLLAIDVDRRKLLTESETLKAEQNRLGPEIAKRKRAGEDASELLARSTALKAAIAESEERLKAADEAQETLLAKLPNTPDESVPAGGEEDAQVVRPAERPLREFDFEPKAHWDLGTGLGLFDFERGVKLAGSGFVLYTGLGARLERALIQFMLDLHAERHGYTELGLPFVLSRESITASGHIVKFGPEMYRDEESDLFFVPTAEPALVNVHRGETLEPGALPLKYVAYTPCWRREAGAAGKDTRGLQRVHQFDKVEIFRYALPETSADALEEMTREACAVLDALELPYRVLLLAAGDIAFAASKTLDVEVWAPGVGKWLEVSSASNCTDFQARRANIRFRREAGAKPEFPHLLNASGTALPRVVAALLETHQNADGSVTVPEALRPYLGGRERLEPAA